MDKLINKFKDMLVRSKLHTYKELDKMADITIQAKFHENFEILETASVFKDVEIYFIHKSDIRTLMIKNKAFKEKEEVKKIDTKQYGWSFSEDYGFDGYYDTLEECFKEARESNEDNKMIVFIGEKTEWESSIDGIETIEQMQVDADNELGEIAENFLVNVSREQIKKLEDGLNEVYHEWLTKHNFKLDYITEIKKYNLETGKVIKSLK